MSHRRGRHGFYLHATHTLGIVRSIGIARSIARLYGNKGRAPPPHDGPFTTFGFGFKGLLYQNQPAPSSPNPLGKGREPLDISPNPHQDSERLCACDRVTAFLKRLLEGEWPSLWLDAPNLKARQNNRVASVTVVPTLGVNADGRREVSGMDIGLSGPEGPPPVSIPPSPNPTRHWRKLNGGKSRTKCARNCPRWPRSWMTPKRTSWKPCPTGARISRPCRRPRTVSPTARPCRDTQSPPSLLYHARGTRSWKS
ncbi:MAG: transposase [Rhodospirillum sp.]|nr:transposase [Rhodospirillum sp.]MCF8490006.1 transposase [Rhodospirillum sp.]MCF8498841.1 transposase [Rhodospirillum sp.]